MLADRRFRIIAFLVFFAGPVLSQSNSDSPYSRFGLGIMSQPGFTQSRGMGGTGLGIRDSRQINYLNPASYTSVDTMSFLFDFGAMAHYHLKEGVSGKNDFKGMNLDHIALAFPIAKWWGVGIGVLPYTKVGYSIKQEDYDPNIGFIDYYFTGNGGINQLFLGTSIELFERVSVGANIKYLFGYIDLNRTVRFPFEATRGSTNVQSRTTVSDFIIDLGIQYSQDIGDKLNITVGAIFDNETKVTAKNSILATHTFPGSGSAITDSTYLDPEFTLDESGSKGKIVIPANFGAGITFLYDDKLKLAFDYYQQDWSTATFYYSEEPLTKSNGFYGGMELIPNPRALRGYYNHMAYRIGGHYQNSYLQLDGEQLKDYGISFGVGLPIKNSKSTFNLAIEGGRRGTLENNLIRENYLLISFSVTLHDFWFMKRKFD